MVYTEDINMINTLIATQSVLYQNIKNYHWNVIGKNFLQLHMFFEELYTNQQESIDKLAERIRALDDFPLSVFSRYLEWSIIGEETEAISSEEKILKQLEKDYTLLISKYYEFIEKSQNHVTTDLLVSLNFKHEEILWKIKALRV